MQVWLVHGISTVGPPLLELDEVEDELDEVEVEVEVELDEVEVEVEVELDEVEVEVELDEVEVEVELDEVEVEDELVDPPSPPPLLVDVELDPPVPDPPLPWGPNRPSASVVQAGIAAKQIQVSAR